MYCGLVVEQVSELTTNVDLLPAVAITEVRCVFPMKSKALKLVRFLSAKSYEVEEQYISRGNELFFDRVVSKVFLDDREGL